MQTGFIGMPPPGVRRFARVLLPALLGLCLALPGTGLAQEGVRPDPANQEQAADSPVYQLDPYEVLAKGDEPGTATIERDVIRMMPSPTDTVTDMLRGDSSVQFDMNSRDSSLGGELSPPKISIKGSAPYESSYTINGLNNNNNINPSGFKPTTGHGTVSGGDPQAFFVSPELLESIAIHSENISAEYGGFSGGVVDARLRDPRVDGWHASASFMYTRDEWAHQYYDASQSNSTTSTSPERQPKFDRYTAEATVEGPVFATVGLLMGYTRRQSSIPLYSTFEGDFEKNTQHRLNENFMLRLNTIDLPGTEVAFTAMYAPYTMHLFNPTVKDCDFDFDGGGYNFMLETENDFAIGAWSNSLTWQLSEVSRSGAAHDAFQWRRVPTGYADWGTGTYSNEGAMGNIEQEQATWGWKSVMAFESFGSEWFRHAFKTGLELYYYDYSSDSDGYTSYSAAVIDPTAVGAKSNGVIAGEQYTAMKSEVSPYSRSTNVTTFDLFLEDTIDIGRFTLRPGLRLSYEDVSKNINIAPRLFANLDYFGDDTLNIYGGYNRYYNTGFVVGNALNTMPGADRYRRTSSTAPWSLLVPGENTNDKMGDLDTPYSDEYAAGVSLNQWGALFSFDAVRRDYEKSINASWDFNTFETNYTNDGYGQYWGLTFAVEKTFDFGWGGVHTGGFSATRSMTRTSSPDRDAAYDDNIISGSGFFDSSPTWAMLDGSLVQRKDMPADNYGSPWVFAYTHRAALWEDRIRLMAVLRYEVGGRGLEEVGSFVAPDGLEAVEYETRNYSDLFNLDLALEIDALRYKGNTLTVILEATNLTDRKNYVDTGYSPSTDYPHYSMGRQFYAGVRYEF